eukprot:scaffold27867_cov120-Isochrysis_galbana.AAC.2
MGARPSPCPPSLAFPPIQGDVARPAEAHRQPRPRHPPPAGAHPQQLQHQDRPPARPDAGLPFPA